MRASAPGSPLMCVYVHANTMQCSVTTCIWPHHYPFPINVNQVNKILQFNAQNLKEKMNEHSMKDPVHTRVRGFTFGAIAKHIGDVELSIAV